MIAISRPQWTRHGTLASASDRWSPATPVVLIPVAAIVSHGRATMSVTGVPIPVLSSYMHPVNYCERKNGAEKPI